MMASLKIAFPVDYLELVTYRQALIAIRDGEVGEAPEPWQEPTEEQEFAARVLDHFEKKDSGQ